MTTSPPSVDELYIRITREPTYELNQQFLKALYGLRDRPDEAKIFLERWSGRGDPGDGTVLCLLGLCYDGGVGVEEEKATAVRYYKESADLGNAMAMNNLAIIYDTVDSPFQDTEMAQLYYRKSAVAGNPIAMYNLAVCLDGDDTSEAVEWYRKSAELGHPVSMMRLVDHHEEESPRDAIRWLRLFIERDAENDVEDCDQISRLASLHHTVGEPLEALRQYHRALRIASRRPSRDYRAETIRTEISRIIVSAQEDLLDEWVRFAQENGELRAEVTGLRAEVDFLRTELRYRPGGDGYEEARVDFERLTEKIEEDSL